MILFILPRHLLYQKGAKIRGYSLCKAVKFPWQRIPLIKKAESKLYRKGVDMPYLLSNSLTPICGS